MSKKSKSTKSPKSPAKKGSKKPTVAEAVAARKAEKSASQAAAMPAAVTTAAEAEVTAEAATATAESQADPKGKGKNAKAPKKTGPRKSRIRDDGTYSVLDAAHKVLQEAGTPLDAQTICERALAEGYWKTNGKTPQATIYAAMIREIAAKGPTARFKKVDRGQFTTAN